MIQMHRHINRHQQQQPTRQVLNQQRNLQGPIDPETPNPDANADAKESEPTAEELKAQVAKLEKKWKIAEEHRNKAEKSASELSSRFAEIEQSRQKEADEAARKEAEKGSPDAIKALEESWSQKLAKREESLASERDQFKNMVMDLTSKAEGKALAAKLFGSHSDLLESHVLSRITTEFGDDGPKIRILDASGQPSALSLDELADSFKSDPKFAPFIVGSKASGGGAKGAGGGGASAKMTRSKWNALSPTAQSEFFAKGGVLTDN